MFWGSPFLSGIGGMETFSGQQGADYFTDVFVSNGNRCLKLLSSVDPSVILRALLLWKECLTHINI